jgi:hypothetical protein
MSKRIFNAYALSANPQARERNERKDLPEGWERCYLCGSPVDPAKADYIEVFGGGMWAALEKAQVPVSEEDSGYMGCHPVGSTCMERIRYQLQEQEGRCAAEGCTNHKDRVQFVNELCVPCAGRKA